jgi:hypothetical protein
MADNPLIPSTTVHLQAGDFWSIQLADGRYSAGRVLQVIDRVTVLGCVLDWAGDEPPTEQSIAGANVLAAGRMHVKTIADCGDGIRGNRSLADDDIELPLFRSHSDGPGQRLLQGGTDLGPASEEDRALPVLSTWGFQTARQRANRQFCPRA